MDLSVESVVFYFIAIFIVITSVLTVTTQRIVRSATYLLFTLFATAGIYFLLGYTFLGSVQMVVYAGGIMFYEVALIPMYLLIGVWGSGPKEYAAMKLTLMLMGGSAFLLCGILGIYFSSGATTMNILEIAHLHNISITNQLIWFPMTFVGFGVLGALFPFHTCRLSPKDSRLAELLTN